MPFTFLRVQHRYHGKSRYHAPDKKYFVKNHAERSSRPAVIIRKNSSGNRSEQGADCQAVMMSIFQTFKLRGATPFAQSSPRSNTRRDPASYPHYQRKLLQTAVVFQKPKVCLSGENVCRMRVVHPTVSGQALAAGPEHINKRRLPRGRSRAG